MSKTIEMLEINPGRMSPGGRMTEHLESRGHKCQYCQGNGFFWQEDEFRERYKDPCPVCKGSGKLDADITIEWKANNSITFK